MKKYESPIMEKVEFVPQDNMTVSGEAGGMPTTPTRSTEPEEE